MAFLAGGGIALLASASGATRRLPVRARSRSQKVGADSKDVLSFAFVKNVWARPTWLLRPQSEPSAAPEVSVEGTIHPGFAPVAELIGRHVRAAKRGGAAVCVYHHGKPVVDVWVGTRNDEGAPWKRDTIAMSFSTTKGVISTLVHILDQRGLLSIDAPVATYWPEFAQAGKAHVTVGDLLTHRAGLHLLPPDVGHASSMLDWDAMIRALAASPVSPLGERSAYQALTFGFLVGEIIRRVTNMTVGDAIAHYVATPLGMSDLFIGAKPSERDRVAALFAAGASSHPTTREAAERAEKPPEGLRARVEGAALRAGLAAFGIDKGAWAGALSPPGIRKLITSPAMLDVEIPAMNGVFSARSLARMYAMMAEGGSLDGVRLLSPESIARAGKIRVHGRDAVLGFRMKWRLGYHLVGTLRGAIPGAFGHFGFGGSGAFADPRRNLAVAMTLNRVAGTPVGDVRMLQIAATAAACADRVR